MIKYLELALSQEVYEYLEELDEMNWSAQGNVLNQYLRNTSIGTTVTCLKLYILIHSVYIYRTTSFLNIYKQKIFAAWATKLASLQDI
jgi:hypothetical protein